MTRLTLTMLLTLLASGCAVYDKVATPRARTPEEIAAHSSAVQQKQQLRAFNVCMKQTMGGFGDFKSQESHIRAAEICKDVMHTTTQHD